MHYTPEEENRIRAEIDAAKAQRPSSRAPSETACQLRSLDLVTGSDEAIRIIEDAHLRMMAAWRDLMEWEQLAINTRKAFREAGKDPDCEPYCPSQAGINRTLMVRLEIGVAAQKLRRLLPNQNA